MTKSEMWVSNVVAVPLGVLILVCLQITILATPFHQLRRMNIRNCMITSKIRRLLSKLKEVGAKEALSTLMKMIRWITTLKVRTLSLLTKFMFIPHHLGKNWYDEKCRSFVLNGIHLKWIIGTNSNWKNQNPRNHFGATCKTALPIRPIYWKNGPNGPNWQCSLAGSSKTAPRILIFSIAMGSKPSF